MVGCDARLKRIRSTALLLAALSVLVVLVSAYIRLAGAGLGCTDWPGCYGQVLAGVPQAPQYGVARLLHRISASLALVLAGVLVWQCLRPQPIQPVARNAVLLLLLMLALSALGILSADPRLAMVGFLNIVGGLGLVIFAWRVVIATDLAPQRERMSEGQTGILLRTGMAVLSLTVMLGAWIGASYAAVSCSSLPHCGGIWWPSLEGLSALNPFMKLHGPVLPGDTGGQTLNLLHRYSAVGALLLLGITGIRALTRKATRNAARAVLFLLVVEFSLGVATVASGLSLPLAVGHTMGAAALLAAVVTLLRR